MEHAGERPGPLHEPVDGRQRAARAAVVEVAAASGVDPAGAGIWRVGSAVLVGLPAVPALARVDEPVRAADAERQVVVSGLLTRLGVPAVTIVGTGRQPVTTGAGPVTLWRWEPPIGPPVGPHDIGKAARRLHDATRPAAASAIPDDVPPHAPLTVVAAELDRAELLGATDAADLRILREHTERLGSTWPEPGEDPLGPAVVHGDLHRGNVVAGRFGPVLADLELAGRGPASADVVPQVVAVRRYGADPADLEAFVEGYGADPGGWPGLAVLAEAYELWVTVWAVVNRTTSSRAEREAQVRLQRWRSGSSPVWSLR